MRIYVVIDLNFTGGAQNHGKSERELHKVTEEPEPGSAEAMEIDLKCAEKVTDSDVESNADDKVCAFSSTSSAIFLISLLYRADHIKKIKAFTRWAAAM